MNDAYPRLARNQTPILVGVVLFIALLLSAFFITRRIATRTRAVQPAELSQTLGEIRGAITRYHAKHGAWPARLDDLVRDGELREVPRDPLTGSAATWRTEIEQEVRSDDFRPGAARPRAGIIDVRSSAPGADPSGKPWTEY
jgi:general secretion pathway protein G